MIRIHGIKLPLDYNDKIIKNEICKALNVSSQVIEKTSIHKLSVDARRKNNIHFSSTIDVVLNGNYNKILRNAKTKNGSIVKPYTYKTIENKNSISEPLIVGAGPAGLFAALILAQSGAKPIIIDRGFDVDKRDKDVKAFWSNGKLNTNSNVQFGEGGAGTFSDGKLNTGTKDKRATKVLNEFVKHGAPKEILYEAKPHIGTDYLKTVVKSIRKELIKLGATVLFNTTLVDIIIDNGNINKAVVLKDNKESIIKTDNIILALGHSARDTFEMIYKKEIIIEPKSFSIGARIEHIKDKIDKAQYGDFANHKSLGSAEYKLHTHLPDRSVYTFCMCPGGYVVGSGSEENGVVTNGMSTFARNNVNSNSALLVGVSPKDYGSDHKLAGVYFQRKLEKAAFKAGGENYNAPVQRVDDFLNNVTTTKLGDVTPTYKPGVTYSNLNNILPSFATNSMKLAIKNFNNRLKGFSDGDAVLTGVETRSSSPIRILRSPKTLESVSVNGLYPCGEGAGYAGGIMSAAVDGIKCAEKLLSK